MSKMSMLATSLISAGIATIITAKVVEKQMLAEIDEQVQRELNASVDFLVKEDLAEPKEEYLEKRVGSLVDIAKPSLDDVLLNTQRVRYDNIVEKEEYTSAEEAPPEEVQALPELEAITAEAYISEESGYLQSTLTYFADGGVWNEDNEFVVDFQDMIGTDVPPFGLNSGEPHVVYLRNNRIRREFEVIQDDALAADILADPERTVQ